MAATRCLRLVCVKKYLDPQTLKETELRRCLTKFDLTAFGIASTLGAGIYILAGVLARNVTGPAIVLSFLIAAIASSMAGLCYAEFGARVPRAGSAYVYSYVVIGELCAFIIGWNLILEYIIGASSVARAWSSYFDSLLEGRIRNFTISHLGDLKAPIFNYIVYPDFTAFSLVILFLIPLLIGIKISSLANAVVTIINLLVITFIIFVGFYFARGENWTNNFAPYGISGVLEGAASCFFAFVGFDVIVTTAEEAVEPSRDVPIAILLTLAICFVAYFGVSAVLTLMWPYNELAAEAALPKVFEWRGATYAKYIIAVGALCGLTASLIGSLLPLPRLLYAMASDGVMFKFLARIHPKTEVPVIATVISGILAAILALLLELQELVEMMSIGTLQAYTIVAVCVLLLRYQPGSVGIEKVDQDEILGSPKDKESSKLIDDNQREPSDKTAAITSWAVLAITVIFVCLSALLIWGTDALSRHEAWAIFLVCLLSGLLLGNTILILRQPQNRTPLPFMVPCVPLLPLTSIFINIFLMMKLSYLTWIRFVVWMIIGMSIYLLYGVRHSAERLRQQSEGDYIPLGQVTETDEEGPRDESNNKDREDASGTTN